MRQRHQENVRFLKNCLTRAGLPQLPSASHIVPVPVGDPRVCAWICNELLAKHGHYVQSINYPTVPVGEERLRIAPTPFHTRAMMEEFVDVLKTVWTEAGMTLHPGPDRCAESAAACFYCHRALPDDATGCSRDKLYPCGDAVGCPQLEAAA